MKVVLICPSNILYMPYLENYTNILETNSVNYTIINWDRLHIEESSKYRYIDDKSTHRKNIVDYYKYSLFIKDILKREEFDKVVVFGLQLSFFIGRHLRRKYGNEYIVDIRDYNILNKYFSFNNVISNSYFSVISSPGFKEWLPNGDYVVNHNTNIKEVSEAVFNCVDDDSQYNVSYIGAIRDLEINRALISGLKDSNKIILEYHGDGINRGELEDFKNINNIKNVKFTGRYEKKDEEELYYRSDLINVIRYGDNEINKAALPNRLYDSLHYAKPFIAYEGNTLADIIKENKLGLVISNFDNIEYQIVNYLDSYDRLEYLQNRNKYLEEVINENSVFEECFVKFITESI